MGQAEPVGVGGLTKEEVRAMRKRARRIVRWRERTPPLSLAEIAEKEGISKQRVWSIVQKIAEGRGIYADLIRKGR